MLKTVLALPGLLENKNDARASNGRTSHRALALPQHTSAERSGHSQRVH